MPSIEVLLPADRSQLGVISLVDTLTGLTSWGPKYCYGRSDHGVAAKYGNPTADPTRPYGDTPTGGYSVTGLRPVAPAEMATYGAQDALKIDGVTGDAMVRKANGTNDLRIHGGRPKFDSALLRPTNGCLRLLDLDMQGLLATLEASGVGFPFEMTITEGDPPDLVAGGVDDDYDDPETA